MPIGSSFRQDGSFASGAFFQEPFVLIADFQVTVFLIVEQPRVIWSIQFFCIKTYVENYTNKRNRDDTLGSKMLWLSQSYYIKNVIKLQLQGLQLQKTSDNKGCKGWLCGCKAYRKGCDSAIF